jgi:cation/acetate symporter
MVPPHIAAGTDLEGIALTAQAVSSANPDLPNALTPGINVKGLWNQLSLVLGLILGTAGLPHILVRFFTVKNAKAAKKGAEIS